jgi:hypothetical protein
MVVAQLLDKVVDICGTLMSITLLVWSLPLDFSLILMNPDKFLTTQICSSQLNIEVSRSRNPIRLWTTFVLHFLIPPCLERIWASQPSCPNDRTKSLHNVTLSWTTLGNPFLPPVATVSSVAHATLQHPLPAEVGNVSCCYTLVQKNRD